MIGINYEFNLFIFSLAWYLNRWWTPSTRRFRSPVWTRCADLRSCGLTSTVRWWSWDQVGIAWTSFEQFEQFFAFFFFSGFKQVAPTVDDDGHPVGSAYLAAGRGVEGRGHDDAGPARFQQQQPLRQQRQQSQAGLQRNAVSFVFLLLSYL